MAEINSNGMEKGVRELKDNMPSPNSDGGERFKKVQEAQNLLQQIQNERNLNLQTEKAYAEGDSTNLANMQGASGLIAAIKQDPQVTEQVQNFSPQTQQVLQKYGVGKSAVKNTQSKRVEGGNIVVNNNISNVTNNTTTASPPPVPQQPIKFRSSDDGNSKFKIWLGNVFNSQKEAAAKRDKDYRKREWSLRRSASRVTDLLGDITKGIAENLNPKEISNSMTNQFGALLKLIGLTFFLKRWPKILENLNKIVGNGFSGLTTSFGGFKEFLGGSESESFAQVVGGLFSDAIDLLGEKIENFFRLRAEAVKSLPPPDLTKGESLVDKGFILLGYLKDVFTTFLGGSKGLEKVAIQKTVKKGSEDLQGNDESSKLWKNEGEFMDRKEVLKDSRTGQEYSAGALSIESVNEEGKKRNFITSKDINSDGDLRNNTDSSILLGRSLGDMIASGSARPEAVMTGFSALNKSAVSNGGTLVDNDSFNKLVEFAGLNRNMMPNTVADSIDVGNYKFVLVDKTLGDRMDEGLLDPKDILETSGKAAGVLYNIGGGAAGSLFGTVGTIFGTGTAYDAYKSFSPSLKGGLAYAAYDNIKENLDSPNLTAKLVHVDDPRFKDQEGIGGRTYEYLNLSPEALKWIQEGIKVKYKLGHNFDFNNISKSNLKSIDKATRSSNKRKLETKLEDVNKKNHKEYLEQKEKYGDSLSWDLYRKRRLSKNQGVERNIAQRNLTRETERSHSDFSQFNGIEEYEGNSKKLDREFEEFKKTNRAAKFGSNIAESPVGKAYDYIVNSAEDLVSYGRSKAGEWGLIKADTAQPSMKKAMDVLVYEGNLEPHHAAGIVGNLMGESGLNPNAYNPKGGGKGAFGIAQWRADRLDGLVNFAESRGETGFTVKGHRDNRKLVDNGISLETQLLYILKELGLYSNPNTKDKWDGSKKRVLDELEYANDTTSATSAIFSSYEAGNFYTTEKERREGKTSLGRAMAHLVKHHTPEEMQNSLIKRMKNASIALAAYYGEKADLGDVPTKEEVFEDKGEIVRSGNGEVQGIEPQETSQGIKTEGGKAETNVPKGGQKRYSPQGPDPATSNADTSSYVSKFVPTFPTTSVPFSSKQDSVSMSHSTVKPESMRIVNPPKPNLPEPKKDGSSEDSGLLSNISVNTYQTKYAVLALAEALKPGSSAPSSSTKKSNGPSTSTRSSTAISTDNGSMNNLV